MLPKMSPRRSSRLYLIVSPSFFGVGFACKELEAVSKILAEQDEDTAEVDEAEIVGGVIFIPDHESPEVA